MDEQLCDAACRGDLAAVRSLIDEQVTDLNERDLLRLYQPV